MVRLTVNEAEELCTQAIIAAGAKEASAASLARQTVMAECFGQSNNGVVHLFDYLDALREGRIDGQAAPMLSRPARAMILSDAGGGLPQPGFDEAHHDLVETARELGIAVFLQNNSYTCGALGVFAWRIAREGLVAFAGTNGPPLLAGSGSKKPVFCTNPMAFAAPQELGPPLLVDQSSSATAFANIRKAAREGAAIPPDWAIDASGNPTTDPHAAMKGAMVAFGSSRGANIALMIEIMSAGLSGANWALDAPSFIHGNESPGTGMFLVTIDPKPIDPEFEKRLSGYLARLSGEFGVHVPGLLKGKMFERAANEGIDIPDDLIHRLKNGK